MMAVKRNARLPSTRRRVEVYLRSQPVVRALASTASMKPDNVGPRKAQGRRVVRPPENIASDHGSIDFMATASAVA